MPVLIIIAITGLLSLAGLIIKKKIATSFMKR